MHKKKILAMLKFLSRKKKSHKLLSMVYGCINLNIGVN